LEGLGKLLGTIKMVKSKLNPALEIEGFLMTMYSRSRLANQVTFEVKEHFKHLTYDTIIVRSVRLDEAPSHGVPVTAYDRSSRGAVAYKAMAEEIKNKL
jgi:chromosome partitioning protein